MNQLLPAGIDSFLKNAGWGGGAIAPVAGDASFRRYFRIAEQTRRAMLMFAPPPEENPQPFLQVARWLSAHDMRAPQIFAEDAAHGWVLIEDFGDDRMRDWLDTHPHGETGAYTGAVDALTRLHTKPAGPFAPYDRAVYTREAALLTQWYCPAMRIDVDEGSYLQAWNAVLAPMLAADRPGVTVLRDYHAENIMLLSPDETGQGEQGLIDFQDALVGHPAYDLVSLLQDARRDVPAELERRMLDHYLAHANADDDFLADYARLGAQRNAKIIGIFARLWKRDGKPRYMAYIPRMWEALERDLQHPALAPVATWFDANIPRQIRYNPGGNAR